MDNHKSKRARTEQASKFLDLLAQVDNDETDSQDDSLSDEGKPFLTLDYVQSIIIEPTEGFFVEDWDTSDTETDAQCHSLPIAIPHASPEDLERVALRFRERARNIDKEDAGTYSQPEMNNRFFGPTITNNASPRSRLILVPTRVCSALVRSMYM